MLQLEKLITFKGCKGPLLLIIADGVGLVQSGPANAVSLAHTPTIDKLLKSKYSTRLHAHGTYVGLPTDNDMGNSEVGHNTLGAGRIFAQGATLVNQGFQDQSIFENDTWKMVERKGRNHTIHFLGLLSDGNVHSHIDHLFCLLDRCQQVNIRSVCIHAILDGRDVNPRSAIRYLNRLQHYLNQVNNSKNFNYRIASCGGRMVITMDRYNSDWDMVKRGFDTHVHGIGPPVYDAISEVQRQYAQNTNISDQHLSPFVLIDHLGKPLGKMNSGDAVVLFNFRGDRVIQISQSMESKKFDQFDRGDMPDLFFCGMLKYDADLGIPNQYLINPPLIKRTMGEFMCAENIRTFAISETQKFGHVTYFWNGNRSGYLDKKFETYIEIPSDNINFNQAPNMQAEKITESTINLLKSGNYRFGRINFANADMVGHTGDLKATIQAIETVDLCLSQLIRIVKQINGIVIFTSDHGNADEMFIEKDGNRIERTSHTLNPVPFVIVDSFDNDEYTLSTLAEKGDGGLANVAATVFNLLGYRAPKDYAPSLITIKSESNS